METHPDPLLDLHEQLRQNVLRYMEATAQRSRLQAEMDASLSSLVAAGLAGASSTKVLSGDLDMVGSLLLSFWLGQNRVGGIEQGEADQGGRCTAVCNIPGAAVRWWHGRGLL